MTAHNSGPEMNLEAAAELGTLATESTPRNPITAPADPKVWAALGGAYAVVVTRPGGRYRRRLYFSLDSAQRQADRARARGEHAHLALVRLVPVGEVAR